MSDDFAASTHTRYTINLPSGKLNRYVFQVMPVAPFNEAFAISFSSCLRPLQFFGAIEVLRSNGIRPEYIIERALGCYMSAMCTSTIANIGIQSLSAIMSLSCSTTITLLPTSRSAFSDANKAGCIALVQSYAGSSRMYYKHQQAATYLCASLMRLRFLRRSTFSAGELSVK